MANKRLLACCDGAGQNQDAQSDSTNADSGYGGSSTNKSSSTNASSVHEEDLAPRKVVSAPSGTGSQHDSVDDANLPSNSRTDLHRGKLSALSTPPTSSIIKNWPHSKTVVGRLVYELKDLPTLFVAELETFASSAKLSKDKTDTEDTWADVQNRKIRKEAVKELISLKLSGRSADIAINQKAKDIADHVIAPYEPNKRALEEQLCSRKVKLVDTRRLAKKKERDSGVDIDRCVICQVLEGSNQLTNSQKPRLYWKSLSAFIRMHATQGVVPTYEEYHSEFMQTLSPAKSISVKDSPVPGDTSAAVIGNVPLGLRICPSLNTEHHRLQLDFDIVPFIQQGFIHDIVVDIFRKDQIVDCSSQQFTVLEEFLKDLEVRCAYVFLNRSPGDRADLLDESNATHGRAFRIHGIKMPKDVGSFKLDDAGHTMQSFFNEC